MQRVGVIGVGLKRLAAAELGIEVTAGAHMRKASRVQRCDLSRPGRTEIGLRRLGGSPALATIHSRNF